MDRKETLAHFGIKGMKWGVRRSSSSDSASTVKFLSEDAGNAAKVAQKAKNYGTKSLTNKELQDLITRINLEQQLSRLKASRPSRFQKGTTFVRGLITAGKMANEVIQLSRSPALEVIKAALKN